MAAVRTSGSPGACGRCRARPPRRYLAVVRAERHRHVGARAPSSMHRRRRTSRPNHPTGGVRRGLTSPISIFPEKQREELKKRLEEITRKGNQERAWVTHVEQVLAPIRAATRRLRNDLTLGRATGEAEPRRDGVSWTVPRKRILAMLAAKHDSDRSRIESALNASERALFEAVRANKHRKVVALLAAGVNVNVRTVEGQWEYTPAGARGDAGGCERLPRGGRRSGSGRPPERGASVVGGAQRRHCDGRALDRGRRERRPPHS